MSNKVCFFYPCYLYIVSVSDSCNGHPSPVICVYLYGELLRLTLCMSAHRNYLCNIQADCPEVIRLDTTTRYMRKYCQCQDSETIDPSNC